MKDQIETFDSDGRCLVVVGLAFSWFGDLSDLILWMTRQMLEVGGLPCRMLHRFYYPLSIQQHANHLTQLNNYPDLCGVGESRGTLFTEVIRLPAERTNQINHDTFSPRYQSYLQSWPDAESQVQYLEISDLNNHPYQVRVRP